MRLRDLPVSVFGKIQRNKEPVPFPQETGVRVIEQGMPCQQRDSRVDASDKGVFFGDKVRVIA